MDQIKNLAQQGVSDDEIGRRIGLSRQAVLRHRLRHNIASGGRSSPPVATKDTRKILKLVKKGMKRPEMMEQLGWSLEKVRYELLKVRGLFPDVAAHWAKGYRGMRPETRKIVTFLKRYPKKPVVEVAEKFGRSRQSIYQLKNRYVKGASDD